MTPNLLTQIWMALRTQLEALVLAPGVEILWPGENDTIPENTALEITHMPNRPSREFLDDEDPHFRQGILQIGLLTEPGDLNHLTYATELAGDIADQFPAGLRMVYRDVTLKVTEAPQVGQGFRDDNRGRWITPISVRYELFA